MLRMVAHMESGWDRRSSISVPGERIIYMVPGTVGEGAGGGSNGPQ